MRSSRRHFLNQLQSLALTLALAPEIAFHSPLEKAVPSVAHQRAFIDTFFYGKRIQSDAYRELEDITVCER